jgi:hypothetical protein
MTAVGGQWRRAENWGLEAWTTPLADAEEKRSKKKGGIVLVPL